MIALILFTFYLTVIFWSFGSLPLFRNSSLSGRGLAILFLLKLTLSISLVLVYTYYYTDRGLADIYKYFDDGNTIYESIGAHPKAAFQVMTGIGFDHSDPDVTSVLANTHHFDKHEDSFLESNNRLIIRIHAFLRFFSYGSVYIHSLFFCFLSFMGSIALYRALQQFFDKNLGRILIIPIFLLPSVLFWSSGLLKETLVLFFLSMLLFTSLKLFEMKNILVNLLLSALCLHFLYLSKPFIALSFLISSYLMGTIHFKGYIRIVAILVATLAITWFFYAHNTFICDIMASIISKRNEFVSLGLKMKAGSLVDERILSASCLTPITLIPAGLYNMFMQPFIWSHGLFEKIFGAENLLVLLLTVFTLYNFRKPKRTQMQLAVFCFSFFTLNYILIGITVPIIGALIRYKIFGLLFYLVLLSCFINLHKIISISSNSPRLDFFLKKVKTLLFN